MNLRSNLFFKFAVGLFLTVTINCNILHAEGSLIPDQVRLWTHQDGRTAELRYVTSVGDKVLFADVDLDRVFHVPLKDLSASDQEYLSELAADGSRFWTRTDGTSRRMRFVEVQADKVVFEVPNVGLRTTTISNLVPSDRDLVKQLAKSTATRISRYVRTQVGSAGSGATMATVDATKKAFENKELLQILNAIGTEWKFSAGESESAVKVTFGKLNVSADQANKDLDALSQKAKSQVVQILGLPEKDSKDFAFSITLASNGDGGTKVIGRPIPFSPIVEHSNVIDGACFCDCGITTHVYESGCQIAGATVNSGTGCLGACGTESVAGSCVPVWQSADCGQGCRSLLPRLRRRCSE